MRISDWSSDVCSSDLPQGGLERKEAPLHVSKVAVADPKTGKPTRVRFETKDGKKEIGRASCRERVSVRVDLGGRRIIKKQKTTTYIIYTSTTINTNKTKTQSKVTTQPVDIHNN